jgi:hypothetical protein
VEIVTEVSICFMVETALEAGKRPSELKDVDENEVLIVNGRSGRTRTCDPLLRRQMLYPAELRSHVPEIPVFLL